MYVTKLIATLAKLSVTHDNGSDRSPPFNIVPQADIYKTKGELVNEVEEKGHRRMLNCSIEPKDSQLKDKEINIIIL